MSFVKFYLLIVFSTFSAGLLSAQNCGNIISENKKIGGTHLLRTSKQILVVRGNYTYSLELVNDEKGVSAVFTSKNGVDLNEGDEVIFMDNSNARKSYRFIKTGEITNKRGAPTQTNTLDLDLAAINWFASSTMKIIYIKNNISNRMVRFTVNANRQKEFKA